jgi:hypothetical protein
MYIQRGNQPPGAVGGRYGSGCFHLESRASVSLINACRMDQLGRSRLSQRVLDVVLAGNGVIGGVGNAPSAALAP